MIGGRGEREDSVTLNSRGRVVSHIFVKEPEESLEKILKYVKYIYILISVPNQKHNFIIYECTIFPTFKLIETERYGRSSTE